jgi:hyaluronan synthase
VIRRPSSASLLFQVFAYQLLFYLLFRQTTRLLRLNESNIATFLFFATSVVLIFGVFLSFCNKRLRAENSHKRVGAHVVRSLTGTEVKSRRLVVVMAAYNEDYVTLVNCLQSLGKQSHLPSKIYIVDDGSADPAVAQRAVAAVSVGFPCEISLSYQENQGKRHAQVAAFVQELDAWIYVTMDSDTILDRYALEELVHGFADESVTAVGGVLMGLNAQTNLLTRLLDLGLTSSFLNGRAQLSTLGSVIVHCGGLAAYRSDVVLRYLRFYANQKVLGAPVSCGDDRMLTTLALIHGKSVTQETSIGYTLLPENLSHLTRQRIRWWRSFFWGGMWLIRNMPLTRIAWWLVAWQFVSFTLYSFVTPIVLIALPIIENRFPWELLACVGLIAYIRSVRFLSIRQPGRSEIDHIVSFLLAPIAAYFNFYLCFCLQFVGLLTLNNTSWGTRSVVEVGMAEGQGISR